jgi:beta-glucosidase
MTSLADRRVFLKRIHTLVLLCSLAGFAAPSTQAQSASGSPFRGLPIRSKLIDPATESKIDALLAKMTLEEKVGQLVQFSSGKLSGPGTEGSDYHELVAKGEVGSLFNLENAHSANQYQHLAVEQSRLHIPLLFGLDVIHGYRTIFPVPLGLASTWDPVVVEKAARISAQETSMGGIRWTFSPMVDIARDARWGRIVEGAGEDPFLGSVIARAYVRGYQGKNLSAEDSIAACAKHFVGYGAAEGGRDYNTTEISEHTLREVYLPPFYAALDEGSATVMSAFSALNGVPATANPFTLTEILRNEWKFPGMAVSDWTSVGELIPHGIANDARTAARKALTAGLDMDMQSGFYHASLADLVTKGEVSQARLDEAVRRVLRLKFALGLFDKPYTDESRENRGKLAAGNLEIARTAAERSFVLLKNETVDARPVLPLAKEGQTVALIGPLADDAVNMLGSWAGRGMPQDVVTLKSALEERLGADRVKYAKGGEIRTATDAQILEAVAATEKADVAILALGEDAGEMTGEAASRAHLGLPGRQAELLEKVVRTGKPVVLVLFTGRPLTLPWAFQHVPAAVAAWFPGVQAGPALVRFLYGDVVPTGRLVVSWPRAVGQLPLYYNALNTGRPQGDPEKSRTAENGWGKYLSRYIDERNSPQFPFGYGLSYSEVAYARPELSANKLSAKVLNEALRKRSAEGKGVVTVTAKVTNTGKSAAEETVQLYVGLRGTSVAEPVRALKAFEKVPLAPGETKEVSFPLGPEAFAVWDIHNEWKVEACKARVWVSADSSRGEPVELDITE